MSDERAEPAPPPMQFPPIGFPTIYADNVLNLSHAAHVVKFYFSRLDPSFTAVSAAAAVAQHNPIAQVVMPTDGFVRTVLFFQQALNSMVSENFISRAEIDAIRGERTNLTREDQ